jgi:hypothetical protein
MNREPAEDLAALYRWQPITDKSVMMMHARHAAYMVGVLPESLHDPLLPEAVRDACLESFFVNVRLLAEFLVKSGGPNPRDFTAWDLANNWRRLPWVEADRLEVRWWEIASSTLSI